jgi:hypothetical protein
VYEDEEKRDIKIWISLKNTFNKEYRLYLVIYSADFSLFFYSLGIYNTREGDPVFQRISSMFSCEKTPRTKYFSLLFFRVLLDFHLWLLWRLFNALWGRICGKVTFHKYTPLLILSILLGVHCRVFLPHAEWQNVKCTLVKFNLLTEYMVKYSVGRPDYPVIRTTEGKFRGILNKELIKNKSVLRCKHFPPRL